MAQYGVYKDCRNSDKSVINLLIRHVYKNSIHEPINTTKREQYNGRSRLKN